MAEDGESVFRQMDIRLDPIRAANRPRREARQGVFRIMDGLTAMGRHAVMHECRHILMNPLYRFFQNPRAKRHETAEPPEAVLRSKRPEFALSFKL
jgi:hypothetical protein